MFDRMLYNQVVQLVQYCLFHCTSDCWARSLQLPRLGWRPSALLGLLVLFCIIARPSAPFSSTLRSLLPGARTRARRRPVAARRGAHKAARAAAASSGVGWYLFLSRAAAGGGSGGCVDGVGGGGGKCTASGDRDVGILKFLFVITVDVHIRLTPHLY